MGEISVNSSKARVQILDKSLFPVPDKNIVETIREDGRFTQMSDFLKESGLEQDVASKYFTYKSCISKSGF